MKKIIKKNKILNFIFYKIFRRKINKFSTFGIFAILVAIAFFWISFVEKEPNKKKYEIISPSISSTDLLIDFLDVGKADCAIIHDKDIVIIIDGGLKNSELSVVSYMKDNLIGNAKNRFINLMILTHPHADHYGQLSDILDNFETSGINKFTKFITSKSHVDMSDHKGYEKLLEKLKLKNIKIEIPKVGQIFNIGRAKIEILGPIKEDKKNVNNNSIVLKLSFKNKKFLFTGDAEKAEEKDIIDSGQDLSADVIKIGHHGSKTSSSLPFLKSVNPKYAVISAGNHYNKISIYPQKEVADRLNLLGINYFVTKELGTIRFAISQEGELKVPQISELETKEAA